MKIKHFAGYGSVNARKVSEVKLTTDVKRVVIKVIGDHEWGLYRNDRYDIYNWLMSRFCKDCENYKKIYNVEIEQSFDRVNNELVEVCIYTISYII